MAVRICVRNFRALRFLDWSPDGLCVLCGPNGSGKSTVLDALRFLHALFSMGKESALRMVDDGTDQDVPIEFSIEVGDLVWMVRLPIDGTWCCARVLWDRHSPLWMRPLVNVLDGLRIHDAYQMSEVKRVTPVLATKSTLHTTGRNLWSVLANWKESQPCCRRQFEWVMTEIRRAFPGIIRTVEFDRGLPYLFRPEASDVAEGLLPNRAADGVLTGLLHLTAIASAKDGSMIAFDDFERSLHPHAIRSIIAAMRQQSEDRKLTVVLTTHSPVVLNQFRNDPERVFVLGHGEIDLKTPARMTELHTEEWIAQGRIGSLYERLAFGAPGSLVDDGVGY